ncbi:hypothetical protein Nepgr_007119 [Nepenthes gracilis]|uniref:Uncharacterized protein n=1 Tax=Nepenthes gracilis TaxID=150966 RepID=A0AAD3XI21_NEPGR|nr:hypothetical protein Nepgr_007119 [Nepenthes gracilis]
MLICDEHGIDHTGMVSDDTNLQLKGITACYNTATRRVHVPSPSLWIWNSDDEFLPIKAYFDKFSREETLFLDNLRSETIE